MLNTKASPWTASATAPTGPAGQQVARPRTGDQNAPPSLRMRESAQETDARTSWKLHRRIQRLAHTSWRS
eukprot:7934351-Pyramimonas_sp.AAC.1